jgi:SAM-dependent methyltransferase
MSKPTDHASGAEGDAVSAWVRRFAPLIKAGGRVLDLACGTGRHACFLASRGHAVVAVDRDIAALELLRRATSTPQLKSSAAGTVETLQCDLESSPWPFPAASFDAIVVSNYLHRPLFTPILAAMRPHGVLIYETFAEGHEKLGRPRNPSFLLRRDELLQLIPGNWIVVAFEQGLEDGRQPAVRQRICAVQTTVWPVQGRAAEHAG